MKRLASRSTWWHMLPHKRESQICILAEGGELMERRIRTEPQRLTAVLGDRPCEGNIKALLGSGAVRVRRGDQGRGHGS